LSTEYVILPLKKYIPLNIIYFSRAGYLKIQAAEGQKDKEGKRSLSDIKTGSNFLVWLVCGS